MRVLDEARGHSCDRCSSVSGEPVELVVVEEPVTDDEGTHNRRRLLQVHRRCLVLTDREPTAADLEELA